MRYGNRERTRLGWVALMIVAVWAAPTADAQQEPPPHVRAAVDAVLELLKGDGEKSIQSFIDGAMVPSKERDPAALAASLREIRERTKGLTDSVSVEGEPDGVRLILGGHGREAQIRVVLGPAGIAALDLVSSDAAAGPPRNVDAAVRSHVEALETSADGAAEEVLARFEREHFSHAFLARTNEQQRQELIKAVRAAAAEASDAFIDVRDGRFILSLESDRLHEIAFTVQQVPPFRIDTLEIESGVSPRASMELTRDNLVATFDRLEQEGFSGVVHVRLGGEVVLERAFGMANAALGIPVEMETIFGTGSRPIDFTIVSIYLLEQQGRLRLDDTIDKYFDRVPADKRTMTLRHLLTGRSGLPDFFHTQDDWDADLAWVDRTTAERRMLAQPLRFAPGTDDAHSHGAFVLLAAVIERVSGQSYASFVRDHFLDPAGMSRTGFYGESKGLSVKDFAVGGGPNVVGVPNIPPNWGPTSWLVMGSGGMYSTLPDLLRFYRFVRAGEVLQDRYADRYRNFFASLDGSDRGFELFHVYNPSRGEAIVMVNMSGILPEVRALIGGLRRLVDPEGGPH